MKNKKKNIVKVCMIFFLYSFVSSLVSGATDVHDGWVYPGEEIDFDGKTFYVSGPADANKIFITYDKKYPVPPKSNLLFLNLYSSSLTSKIQILW